MRTSIFKLPSQNWGEDSSPSLKEDFEPKDEHVSPIRGGLVTLTGNHYRAVILNQLLYWTPRVKDFDLMLEEEKACHQGYNASPRYGWIYKTAEELIKETLLCVDRTSIRRYLNFLIKKEWVFQRTNPFNKWDKTTQYRINLKKIQQDLLALGQSLPDAYTKGLGETFSEIAEVSSGQNNHSNGYDAPSKGEYVLSSEQSSLKPAETSNGHNAPSSGQNNHSNGYDAPSNGQNARSNTKTTIKNTNKEHTQDAGAREDFKNSILMVEQWCKHIGQEVRLTEERKHQLKALYHQHFQSDLPQWTQFCQRIQASPFLMGEGARKWRVSLDWILTEGNILKVLEGNFDDSESLQLKKSAGTKINRDQERAETLASIQEPTWQDWCTQLSCRDQQKDPVSLFVLKEIANASFAEFDGKLAWIESEDPKVLNCINDLRLQLLSIAQRFFPQARNIRTQLRAGRSFACSQERLNHNPQHTTIHQGEVHAE